MNLLRVLEIGPRALQLLERNDLVVGSKKLGVGRDAKPMSTYDHPSSKRASPERMATIGSRTRAIGSSAALPPRP